MTSRLIQFFKENWVIVAAIAIFIVSKFFLIGILWENREIPPTPDDSYVYILHIDSTLRCPNLLSCNEQAFSFNTYAGFDHLTYRIFLGTLGKILHLDAFDIYRISFYIGTILFIPVILFFLNRLNRKREKTLIAFSIIILALYNGTGSYHGFFWVVPSFFVLLFFFVILGIILDDSVQHWKRALMLITPFYVFMHVLSLYFLIIPFLFLFFRWLFTRTINVLALKKTVFLSILACIVYMPVAFYYAHTSYGNPYDPVTIVTNSLTSKTSPPKSQETGSSTENKTLNHRVLSAFDRTNIHTLAPGLKSIQNNYFRWIFPNWIASIIFFSCIYILVRTKRFQLLSLYFAGLTFSIASSINVHGERSLLFLWPMTFLLYGQAGWFGFRYIREKVPLLPLAIFFYATLATIIVFVGIIAALYAYSWNIYLNQARNFRAPTTLAEYLIHTVDRDEMVAYSNDMDFLDNYLFMTYGSRKPKKTIEIERASYYVSLNEQFVQSDAQHYRSSFQKFFRFISKIVSFNRNETASKTSIPIPSPEKIIEKISLQNAIIYRLNTEAPSQ